MTVSNKIGIDGKTVYEIGEAITEKLLEDLQGDLANATPAEVAKWGKWVTRFATVVTVQKALKPLIFN